MYIYSLHDKIRKRSELCTLIDDLYKVQELAVEVEMQAVKK